MGNSNLQYKLLTGESCSEASSIIQSTSGKGLRKGSRYEKYKKKISRDNSVVEVTNLGDVFGSEWREGELWSNFQVSGLQDQVEADAPHLHCDLETGLAQGEEKKVLVKLVIHWFAWADHVDLKQRLSQPSSAYG